MTELVSDLFTSGRVVDFILLVVVVEVIVLAVFPRLRGAMSLTDVALLIAPGVMLMLALRGALTGAPHTITAAVLAAAFVFHLWDIIRRRRGAA
ncbi:hypothetical protein L2D00_13940 [Hyphomonadaceae bacterium BL14]|nr:hypothetical protein L2D00_13940 [Hyphomonadaceae bacterium BL14]